MVTGLSPGTTYEFEVRRRELLTGGLREIPLAEGAVTATTRPTEPDRFTVWTAMLTVGTDHRGIAKGCEDNHSSFPDCSTALSPNSFTYLGKRYTINASMPIHHF